MNFPEAAEWIKSALKTGKAVLDAIKAHKKAALFLGMAMSLGAWAAFDHGVTRGKVLGEAERCRHLVSKQWQSLKTAIMVCDQEVDMDKDWPAKIVMISTATMENIRSHSDSMENQLNLLQEDTLTIERVFPGAHPELHQIREECSRLRTEFVDELRRANEDTDLNLLRKRVRAVLGSASRAIPLAIQ